ncbi:MAG: alpha/beta hydrolase family protein [Caulobacterales bacterium]
MRVKSAAQAVRRTLSPSRAAWSAAALALWALWAVLFLWFVFSVVLPHFSVGKVAGLAGLFAALALISAVLLCIVELLAAPTRAFRVALLFAFPPTALLLALLPASGLSGLLIGSAVVLACVSLISGAGVVLLRRRSPHGRVAAGVSLFLGLALVGLSAYALIAPAPEPNPALAGYHLKGRTLAMPDPGRPGPYKVTYFTYGSGTDRLRPEFGAGVRFRTRSVDGSKLDKLWAGPGGWLRTRYWGFDSSALPLQGRVWMPDTRGPGAAQGPFPLVLLVHGNYEMEVASDTGYAYLGELLASQGFIVVSVDENFLNGSIEDFINPLTFRFGKENNVRAWLLLEHLAQWRAWNADRTHPLFGKVDMNRIALVGHSRGGEAVATANAFNKLDRDPDDATIPFDFHFNLRAIGAIAPADGQYLPRGRPTPMLDTNYFVIEGSMDGDVTSFVGSAQYERASFTGASKAFKASVYVKGANHTQFSTGWGRYDSWLPSKVLLDERPIMDAAEQRQILKVYLSAFLHAALNGEDGYRPLFQDARNGAGWLPDHYLVNNYADSDTLWLANFEEDLDPSTGSTPGVRITGRDLSLWRESFVSLKSSPLDTYAAVLGWDDRVHTRPASYRIDLPTDAAPKAAIKTDANTALVFSASDAGVSSLPDGYHPQGGRAGGGQSADRRPLDWTIVLTDASGGEARLPLSHDQMLYPQVRDYTLRSAALNGAPPSEIVMRRFRFPLRDFAAINPKLDLVHLLSIRFDFDRSARGAIVLDDVGLAPE